MSDAGVPKRILIFDDDADFRKLLEVRLGKLFPASELEEYDPIASGVPDPDFDWSRYDVLLLDYFLCIHGVTGLDIHRQNSKNPLFPATIMLTGAGNEEIAVRALKSGVSDYIRKETLDKEELRSAIVNAYDESKLARQKASEATLHSHAFNKSLFYQQLERPEENAGDRVLLVVRLDHADKLIEKSSVLVRDNVVRYIAKQAFEVFHAGNCNPSITRLGEISIGLIIDNPGTEKTLGFNLEGVCSHLAKRPYKFEGLKVSYTVSIGIVHLAPGKFSAREIMTRAKAAVEHAARSLTENSYHIYDESKTAAVATEAAPAPPPAAVEKPAPVADAGPENKTPSTAVKAEQPVPLQEKSVEAEKVEDRPAAATPPDPEKEETEKRAKTPPPQSAADTVPVESIIEPGPIVEDIREPQPVSRDRDEKQDAAAPPVSTPVDGEKPPERRKRERDESILDNARLDMAALELKRSFQEKRVMQTFQPIISLLADEEENGAELYNTSLQLIQDDGKVLGAEEIFAQIKEIPAFHQYINRWMLREAIGRAIHAIQARYIFVMKISEASLADATLFNWLRDLLAGLDEEQPGQAVALEISAATFAKEQKKASALMTYLHKSHGFRFVLAEIDDVETVRQLTGITGFDMLKLSPALIRQLAEESSGDGGEEEITLLNSLKQRGMGMVADNIEDATTLTEVISIGADYAIGEFIGEASTQLDDMTNVESFEIS